MFLPTMPHAFLLNPVGISDQVSNKKSPGDKGLDVVLRVRGTMFGGKGNRICPSCKSAGN